MMNRQEGRDTIPAVKKAAWRAAACAALFAALGVPAHAQTVTFNGVLGERALLVIDGQARTVAVGDSAQGVKLLRVDAAQAQVQVGGKTQTLRIGGSLVGTGGQDGPNGQRIILPAGPGGHFTGLVNISGRSLPFVVDTGATMVTLGRDQADQIGLDYQHGGFARSSTANGEVTVRTVTLTAVRVGDVLVSDVTATVLPQSLPYVLLGNSFLSRFQIRRDNDMLVLEKKP